MKKINYFKNININYGFIFLKNMNLTSGIWMLLLIANGQSLFQAGVLEGIFHITSFLMETPTGVIADIYGKKVSRLLSVLVNTISLILFISSHSFIGYAFAFIACAISYNLESGAGEALVYDSLRIELKQDKFMKITGNIEVIFQLTAMLALLLGGFIGNQSYVTVYLVSILINVFAFIIGFSFKEPRMFTSDNKISESVFVKIKNQYKDCFKLMKESKRIVYLISFSAIMSTFITISFFYLQVLWKSNGFIESQIGFYLALSCICGAVGGFFAYKINKVVGEKVLLRYSPFIYCIGIFLLYFTSTSMISFAVLSFMDSVIFVSMREYIHQLIPSDKRATIISFESTILSFFMICLFPIFGGLSDLMNINSAFLFLGIVALLIGIYNYYSLVLKRKEKTKVSKFI